MRDRYKNLFFLPNSVSEIKETGKQEKRDCQPVPVTIQNACKEGKTVRQRCSDIGKYPLFEAMSLMVLKMSVRQTGDISTIIESPAVLRKSI